MKLKVVLDRMSCSVSTDRRGRDGVREMPWCMLEVIGGVFSCVVRLERVL